MAPVWNIKLWNYFWELRPALTFTTTLQRVSVCRSVIQLDLANAVQNQPAFLTRETENDVKLKPGETLVLSGLII